MWIQKIPPSGYRKPRVGLVISYHRFAARRRGFCQLPWFDLLTISNMGGWVVAAAGAVGVCRRFCKSLPEMETFRAWLGLPLALNLHAPYTEANFARTKIGSFKNKLSPFMLQKINEITSHAAIVFL